MLKAPPGVPAVAPSTEATLKLQPMLIRWLVTARPLLSVCVAACDPVASHCFAWLVVEMRREASAWLTWLGGSARRLTRSPCVEIGAGPYFKPYERDSASVQAAEVVESAADAATAVERGI